MPLLPTIVPTTNAAVAPRPAYQTGIVSEGVERLSYEQTRIDVKKHPKLREAYCQKMGWKAEARTDHFCDHFYEPVCLLVFEPLPRGHPARSLGNITEMNFGVWHGCKFGSVEEY